MKKVMVWSLITLAFAACITGLFLQRRASRMEAVHREFHAALQLYSRSAGLVRAGLLPDADLQLGELTKRMAAHKGIAAWENLQPYVDHAQALLAYGQAEKEWMRYVRIRAERDSGPYPDAKAMLAGYQKLQSTYRTLAARAEFANPHICWRLKNDAAVAAVWQLVVRAVMLDAKFEELKPIYDVALADFKTAITIAEKAGLTFINSGDIEEDPVLIVSQNLDFMTRLGEAMQQAQPQQPQPPQQEGNDEGDGDKKTLGSPRRGLGDFLSRAMAKAQQGQGKPQGMGMMLGGKAPTIGRNFLPLPQKGIGTQRLPAQGTR